MKRVIPNLCFALDIFGPIVAQTESAFILVLLLQFSWGEENPIILFDALVLQAPL